MFSYEMDIVFEIDNTSHLATATKDRTSLFDGKPDFSLEIETGKQLKEWASQGKSEFDEAMDQLRSVNSRESLINVVRAFVKYKDHPDFKVLKDKKKEEYPKPS